MGEVTKPVRVLIIAHGHPALSIGGAEHAAFSLFQSLQTTDGIEPRFLAWAQANSEDDPLPHIVRFAGRSDEFLFRAPSFDDFFLAQSQAGTNVLSAFLKEFGADVVHFHHYINIGIEIIAVARRMPACRIFVTLHEYRAICNHYGTMVRASDGGLCEAAEDSACTVCFPGIPAPEFDRRRNRIQYYFQQADLFISPSRFLRSRYIAWGIAAQRIVVIDNGVVAIDQLPTPRVDRNPTLFGYFGQIHPFKGLHCLLSAFDALGEVPIERRPQLVVHGAYLELNHPDYVDQITGLMRRHRGRVRFAGPYRQDELNELMAKVDWVVVPSVWWENAPVVIDEALIRRRPVICSDIGGMKEKVRPGKDGFHFRTGDSTDLAQLMTSLSDSPLAWHRLQSTIRRPASVEASAAIHVELYRQKI